MRWEFKLHSPACASVLSTAGGLVLALDAGAGKPLWDFQTGGSISSNPISFTMDGHQYVAIAAYRVLYVFGP